VTRPRITADTARARLTAAAETLRTSRTKAHKDAAEAIDAVLAPGGWRLLRPKDAGTTGTNLALGMDQGLKAALVAAAEERNAVLSEDVSEGFRRFLAGQWTPDKPRRATRNSGATTSRTNLNVRPDGELRERVREHLPAASAQAGWRITETHVAIGWLLHHYGIDPAALPTTE
jgi:hypothetical protein